MLALVVADDLLHRDSLRAMLIALANADTIDAADCDNARGILAAIEPDLVLIDGSLPLDEVLCLIDEMSHRQPHVQCAVMRVEPPHRAALESAGADLIVLEGEPAERFFDQLARWFEAG